MTWRARWNRPRGLRASRRRGRRGRAPWPPSAAASWQAPPAYSAIKVGGERAYALARAGETVELPPREIEVHSLELTAFAPASNTSVTGGPPPPADCDLLQGHLRPGPSCMTSAAPSAAAP